PATLLDPEQAPPGVLESAPGGVCSFTGRRTSARPRCATEPRDSGSPRLCRGLLAWRRDCDSIFKEQGGWPRPPSRENFRWLFPETALYRVCGINCARK